MRTVFPCILLLVLDSPAVAASLVTCPALPHVEATSQLADIPAPIVHSLARHVPNLSPPDAPFNGGDALDPRQHGLLNRRLIAAFHNANRWVIAYEAAGIGFHDVVVAYDLEPNAHRSHIVFKSSVLPMRYCETVTLAFDSRLHIEPYW